METAKKSVKYFVSYAQLERAQMLDLMDRLKTLFSLSKVYAYEEWVDDDILLGEDWSKAIKTGLVHADMAIPLLSPRFFTREYILKFEIPGIKNKILAPVIMRPLDFALLDLKGFQSKQCFLWESNPGLPRKAYSECRSTVEKDAFAMALFKQIERRLARDLR